MFTTAIKTIKSAIKSGSHVTKEQTSVPGDKADAIYIDGKLAVIISETLLPWWKTESKKAKLNVQLIPAGLKGTSLI